MTEGFLYHPHDHGGNANADEVLMRQRFEGWMNHGFDRINYATMSSGAIPSLHTTILGQGVNPASFCYLTFDAREESYGFPVPAVRTRYILPVGFQRNAENIRKHHPGIALVEVVGLAGTRDITVQMGLKPHELFKVANRWRGALRSTSLSEKHAPSWWSYPYPAFDMTMPYDLNGNIEEAVNHMAPEEASEEVKGQLEGVYTWGDTTYDLEIRPIDFELESLGKTGVDEVWDPTSSEYKQAIEYLSHMAALAIR